MAHEDIIDNSLNNYNVKPCIVTFTFEDNLILNHILCDKIHHCYNLQDTNSDGLHFSNLTKNKPHRVNTSRNKKVPRADYQLKTAYLYAERLLWRILKSHSNTKVLQPSNNSKECLTIYQQNIVSNSRKNQRHSQVTTSNEFLPLSPRIATSWYLTLSIV